MTELLAHLDYWVQSSWCIRDEECLLQCNIQNNTPELLICEGFNI